MFSIQFLNTLRLAEIDKVAPVLRPGARVLEIGAGTGQQARELRRRGYDVAAIEVAGSARANDRVFPITDYDGRYIPFPDASFDIVYSSNAMEHIRDLPAMHMEIKRVLRPGGYCVHVLPTHSWRFWTMLSSYPVAVLYFVEAVRRPTDMRGWHTAVRRLGAAILQPRHGERGIGLLELWLFHPRWWRKNFAENGFAVISDQPMGLFYTGNLLCGPRYDIHKRARLAKCLGSSCHIYRIKPIVRA